MQWQLKSLPVYLQRVWVGLQKLLKSGHHGTGHSVSSKSKSSAHPERRKGDGGQTALYWKLQALLYQLLHGLFEPKYRWIDNVLLTPSQPPKVISGRYTKTDIQHFPYTMHVALITTSYHDRDNCKIPFLIFMANRTPVHWWLQMVPSDPVVWAKKQTGGRREAEDSRRKGTRRITERRQNDKKIHHKQTERTKETAQWWQCALLWCQHVTASCWRHSPENPWCLLIRGKGSNHVDCREAAEGEEDYSRIEKKNTKRLVRVQRSDASVKTREW